jgi:tetratricopeptide (TPR) repeat protein
MSLNSTLRILQEHQLVRAVLEPEPGFTFKHALTWEAAYQSLLKSKRQEIHRQVAECYERIFEGKTEEYAAHLAWHYSAAGDEAKTVKYAAMAADAALRRSALREALASYDQALEVGRNGAADDQQLIDIFLGRGRTLELSARHEAAMANYVDMAGLGDERQDPDLRLAALLAQATLYSVPSTVYQPEEGLTLAHEATALARQIGDHRAESRALWILSLLEGFSGDPTRSIEYGETSLALARQYDYREQLAFTLNNLSTSYVAVGAMEKAGSSLAEADSLWREIGNLPMLTDTLSNFSLYYFALSDFERSLDAAQEAQSVSASIGNVWGESYGRFIVGYVLGERGYWSKGLSVSQACLDLAKQAGFIPPQCIVQAQMAFIYSEAGAIALAMARAQAAVDFAERLYPSWRSFAHGILARCYIAASDYEGARREIDQAIAAFKPADPLAAITVISVRVNEARISLALGDHARAEAACDSLQHFRDNGVRSYLTDELLVRGLAALAMGDDHAGRAQLQAAVSEGRAIQCRRSLWRALLAMSELEARSDHPGEAQRLRSEAADCVTFIADHIQTEELKRSFLAQPDVKKAMADR